MSIQLKKEVPMVPQVLLDKLEVDLNTYLTLKNSIYPGAKDESIHMALAYCRTAQLDILQKPVHIVPMSVQNQLTKAYEWRDIIMPGITLYRIQASRSGTYAGKSEPEYGPSVTEVLHGTTVTYPEWCRITVKKVVDGAVCEFSSKEFWRENFASKKDGSPNAMWVKRPFAQLAKCAEAQALRMAWPELIGGVPTAEEMEGKSIEGSYDTVDNSYVKNEKVTDMEVSMLRGKIEEAGAEEINICLHLEIECLEEMTMAQFSEMMKRLQRQAAKSAKNGDLAINKLITAKDMIDD